jgi:hypothetical protein
MSSTVLALAGEHRSITELEPLLWDTAKKAAGRMVEKQKQKLQPRSEGGPPPPPGFG